MLNLKACASIKDGTQIVGIKMDFEGTVATRAFFERFISNFSHGCIIINDQGITFNSKREGRLDELMKFNLTDQIASEELQPLTELILEKQMIWNCDRSGATVVLTGRSISVI